MGAPQVWLEVADMLEKEDLKKMLSDYGKFYMLTEEEEISNQMGLLEIVRLICRL